MASFEGECPACSVSIPINPVNHELKSSATHCGARVVYSVTSNSPIVSLYSENSSLFGVAGQPLSGQRPLGGRLEARTAQRGWAPTRCESIFMLDGAPAGHVDYSENGRR